VSDAKAQRISSGSPFEEQFGFSRAVRRGRRVLVSGTAPIWPDGSCDPEVSAQARRCLEIIGEALRDAPAATMVVPALLDPRWKVEIEAEAELPG
jgi:enamine deaminase RidA (YjgF/YER057c/UK114 family)